MEILSRIHTIELPTGAAGESDQLRDQTMCQFTKPIALLIFLLVTSVGQAEDRPNIIVFYTDDHGHADLSCQGVLDDIRTPNVDALAKSGVLGAIRSNSSNQRTAATYLALLVPFSE